MQAVINKQENPLGTEKVGRLLAKYAVPSIISMLVSALYNIVDQFFIGQSVGMLGNAATNVAFPLSTLCTALALLFGVGGAANFNLSMGAGDRENGAKYVGNAVTLLALFGIFLCIAVKAFLHPLMALFGAEAEVMDYAVIYTGITSVGFPFLIFSTGGSALVRADGSPRYSMFCMLTGAIVNTVLDAVLIFHFQLGMAGAAWATVAGQIVSALMVLGYLLRFKTVRLTPRHFLPTLRHSLKIAALGASNSFNQVAMMLVQIVMNNTMTHYGELSIYGRDIPLACSGIIAKVGMIFFSLVIGISQGLQPIIGFNYGARKYQRVRETYWLAIRAGAIISVFAFLCFQLLPRQIIGLFGEGSPEYFQFAERYFRIFLFFTIINFIQPIAANFFTSIGKATRGIILSLTRQILFLLPLLLILPLFFGIDGVMYAGPISDFTAAILAVAFSLAELRRMKSLEQDEALKQDA